MFFNVVASNCTTRPTLRRVAAGSGVATAGAVVRILAPRGQRRRRVLDQESLSRPPRHAPRTALCIGQTHVYHYRREPQR